MYCRKLLHELSVWHGDYCWEGRGLCVVLFFFLWGGGLTEGEFNVDRGDFGWEGRVLCVCVCLGGGGDC